MNKKIWIALLALLLAFSLAACDAEDVLQAADLIGDAIELAESLEGEYTEGEKAEPEDVPDETSGPSPGEAETTAADEEEALLREDGSYTTADDVALYIHQYGRLPDKFITKKEAKALGWEGGGLEPYAPGKCIGGDRFGNYEGLLPEDRSYTECDIDTLGAKSRGAKRIVFSDDGLVYYTEDHYESFTLLYGEE